MKFCSKCGKELHDDAVVCVGCGCSVSAISQPIQQVPQYGNYVLKKEKKYGGLATAAEVFAILGCISMGWMLLPLAWCLPITISFCNKVNKGEEVGAGLKVCILLFVSLLGGIFALCMGEPKEKENN